jgi:hypothetical protein
MGSSSSSSSSGCGSSTQHDARIALIKNLLTFHTPTPLPPSIS